MLKLNRVKLLAVVGVLAALLVGVGGWLGSQAANKPEGVPEFIMGFVN